MWWIIAAPVLGQEPASLRSHQGHNPLVLTHAVGGTLMLFAGVVALYVGITRRWFRRHKTIGYVYLVGGTGAAASAVFLALADPHDSFGIGAATGSLGAAWLITAAMAFRAVRNRRYDSHREWMVRSYVLTWSFVLCRAIGQSPVEMSSTLESAVAWLAWIGPLLACEVALQWRRGGRAEAH